MSNTTLKKCPEVLLGRLPDGGHAYQHVVRWETFPPNQHPNGSAIRADMILVRATLETGTHRYWGTDKAFIGSDLRMHMSVNPRDEVLSKWEDSDERRP